MLEIINYNEEEYGFPCLVVLGCFDALHAGHRELLKKARLQAKINGLDLGVMTFADGKGGDLVFTFDERLKLLEDEKVKFVFKIDFNDEFKQTSAADFLQAIENKLNVKGYMSGKDFRFGAGAKGKSSTLKNFAEDEENGVWYMPVKDVLYNGEKISTTMIKNLLESGDIKTANELLSRNYFVTGTVENGAERGSNILGYPTMNVVYPQNKVKVKQGVYTVKVTVGEKEYPGIANYGPRPTFDDENCVLEVHLDGYEGQNYGESVTVEFTDYIRDIVKFDSADALKAQLDADMQKIRSAELESEVVATTEEAAPEVEEGASETEQTEINND